jgi:hypothetical protein
LVSFEIDNLAIIFVGKLGEDVTGIGCQARPRELAAFRGVCAKAFNGSLHWCDSPVVAGLHLPRLFARRKLLRR